MRVRSSQVAGQFYPGRKQDLLAFLEKYVKKDKPAKKAMGVIMPHAGYVYSGITAALAISEVSVSDTVVLLGPNHTGYGKNFSLMAEGLWACPLGDVPIDEGIARGLLQATPLLEEDEEAHRFEHSLEVELPFLKYINETVKIVPITIGSHDLEDCQKVGVALGNYLKEKDILIVASTDMTHYESHQSAEQKDREAIDAILALDESKLQEVVRGLHISMCGFLPVYVLLVAAKQLGATKASLIDYRTSGEASGDFNQVVGYVGMTVE